MKNRVSIKKRLTLYVALILCVAILAVTLPAVYFFADNMQKGYEREAVQGLEGLNKTLEDARVNAAGFGAAFAEIGRAHV